MALTPSTMPPLGMEAPEFSLPDPSGRVVSLSDFRERSALLVMFLCNHCPFVKHIRFGLADLARDYADRDLGIVAINSNDAESYPADAPELMVRETQEAGYAFPYLVDATQQVAKAYGAACTPDFFLFGASRGLLYRGQFDSSRPGNHHPVTGESLREAIDASLGGRPVPEPQIPSVGCNIKWKPGNTPDYFGVG